MGMFTQRPEEPTEWAGLPSEPVDQDWLSEQLTGTTTGPDAALLTGGVTSVAISIDMPSTDPADVANTADEG